MPQKQLSIPVHHSEEAMIRPVLLSKVGSEEKGQNLIVPLRENVGNNVAPTLQLVQVVIQSHLYVEASCCMIACCPVLEHLNTNGGLSKSY